VYVRMQCAEMNIHVPHSTEKQPVKTVCSLFIIRYSLSLDLMARIGQNCGQLTMPGRAKADDVKTSPRGQRTMQASKNEFLHGPSSDASSSE
jgi:hypothetical protein